MPREGIDYDGGWISRLGCGVKCSINKLYSLVSSKLAKINTVGPDANGTVNITSDSANLTVTDDPDNHTIILDLDDAIAAPPVSSVNGQTGAVVLDADDLEYSGGDSVKDALDDAVTLSTQQTITADKEETGVLTISGTVDTPRLVMRRGNLPADAYLSGSIRGTPVGFTDQADGTFVLLQPWKSDSGGNFLQVQATRDSYADVVTHEEGVYPSGNPFFLLPSTLDTSSTRQAVHVGYVSATNGSNNIVHTNGNETVAGIKKFTGFIQQDRQYSYIDFIHSDKTVNFHKGIRFMLGSTYNGQILYTWSASSNSCGLSINITNPYNNVNGYFNFGIDSSGNLTLNTNFPKPSNW